MNDQLREQYFASAALPRPNALRGSSIAIFGLSANPPTGRGGHGGIIEYLKNTNIFSEIWILPVYQHMYAAKNQMVAFEHRLEMLNLTVFDNCAANASSTMVRVLPLEKVVLEYFSKEKNLSRTGTIDVLDFLHMIYGDLLQINIVLGTDTFLDLKTLKWKESRRLIASVKTIHVICRKMAGELESTGVDVDADGVMKNIQIHRIPRLSDVSSSKIRNLNPFPLSIWPFTLFFDKIYQLVDPPVYEYMKKNRLYGFSSSFVASKVQPWNLVVGVLLLALPFFTVSNVVKLRMKK